MVNLQVNIHSSHGSYMGYDCDVSVETVAVTGQFPLRCGSDSFLGLRN